MKKSVDCVFVSVPYTDTDKPLIAPAILKSIALQAGKSAVTIDLNAEFVKMINDIQSPEVRFKLLAFFREEQWQEDIIDLAFTSINRMAERILSFNPQIVGISVLTYNCRAAAKYLSWMLKKINPTVKVIIGGAGIIKHFSGRADFAEDLKKHKVIDFYVYGDGEKPLYQYLKTGNTQFSGINMHNWVQPTRQELELFPAPDYDDYDFSLYGEPKSLPILGSRGCVRHCTFCDVHTHWKKFTYRSGKQVFEEMVMLSEKYGIKNFAFTDSLINGNLKEYREMTKLLSEYNSVRLFDDQITWGGFFIFRSAQAFTEEDWKLTTESGGQTLVVGVETLNDDVRKELGKNFTNDDIEFSLQMIRKYNTGRTRFIFLMFSGYPTETDADYEYQVQWWKDHVHFKDVIAGVVTGSPLGILENTPLQRDFDKLGLVSIGPNPEDWVNPKNNNTPEKRIKWNSMIQQVITDLGFTSLNGHDTHYIIERMRATNGQMVNNRIIH